MLFEIGVHAIVDGYYREAISSFASSLERFYEFFIRVAQEHLCASDLPFKNCWKKVSKQSERQLGAFIFLWSAVFGDAPNLLANDQVELRNAVIHKGKIPTKGEAILYGNKVLQLLHQYLGEMKLKLPRELVMKVISRYMSEAKLGSDSENIISTTSIVTLVGLTHPDGGRALEDYLPKIRARKQW